ncbi:hypothetical protein [uncultured Modestobacter sp.]|uniref:hypothetical protein n=1 Tax=uncultured Modestobacter sp. TaxID=380048 RepID=UPI00260969C2|nr:hypothetical protein [uncultured Modestobacter sp.]
MRGTTSSERDGVVAPDRCGGLWRVSCHRAGVLPAPAVPPDSQAVDRLLAPWAAAAASAPPPPRASWVLGRSSRWQGPHAPGASEDPLRDEVIAARNIWATSGGTALGALAVLLLRTGRVARRIAQEPTHPWLVELTASAGPTRAAVWVVAGPDAAQRAVREVSEALQTGRAPAPSGARLLDVRDGRQHAVAVLGWTAQDAGPASGSPRIGPAGGSLG